MKVLAATVALAGVVLVAGGSLDGVATGETATVGGSSPGAYSALGAYPASGALSASGAYPAAAHPPLPANPGAAPVDDVIERYCTRCHSERRMRGNLSLEGFDIARADESAEVAERMIRKLRAGMMPPPRFPPPSRGHPRRVGAVLGGRGGRGGRRPPVRGHPSLPAPQPGRVRARRPRPAGPHRRSGGLAAARPHQRQLRQQRRGPDAHPHPHGRVSGRGQRHRAPRRRRPRRGRDLRHLRQRALGVAARMGAG